MSELRQGTSERERNVLDVIAEGEDQDEVEQVEAAQQVAAPEQPAPAEPEQQQQPARIIRVRLPGVSRGAASEPRASAISNVSLGSKPVQFSNRKREGSPVDKVRELKRRIQELTADIELLKRKNAVDLQRANLDGRMYETQRSLDIVRKTQEFAVTCHYRNQQGNPYQYPPQVPPPPPPRGLPGQFQVGYPQQQGYYYEA